MIFKLRANIVPLSKSHLQRSYTVEKSKVKSTGSTFVTLGLIAQEWKTLESSNYLSAFPMARVTGVTF